MKTLYAMGIAYNPRSWALGRGCVHLEDIVICSLDYCEQNGHLTILIGYVWGKKDVWEKGG